MTSRSAFPVTESKVDLRQPHYQRNREEWQPILDKFHAALAQSSIEGDQKSISRHCGRGQLLPRDRISLLLDQDSPFLELGAFAGYGLENSNACANLISGIGSVCGRMCLVLSHIPTQSGGAWNEYTVIKQNRVTEIATENDLPIVALVQSAGVFLPEQFRVFHKGGQIFRDLAVRSQLGQLSCAVVFGSSTAGGAYHPALSDYTIFVQDQAQVFLGGPPLVKMATGEVIGAEELGGAKIHASVTGLADQIATDEFDAIRKARDWVSSLAAPEPALGDAAPLPPRYSAEDVVSLVDPDIRKPFDMGEVLLRIVDDSRVSVFKPSYGRNLITSWAKINGHTVGIVANQTPVINSDEAAKGAQFIRLCNQQDTPVVFMHNVTGFMVGSKAEHAAIIKRGAQLVSAVSCSKVPHISIICGASYGAGNYAMCGRAYKPRFLFSWPTGRCSVMGAEQLSGVMETIERSSAESRGTAIVEEELKAKVGRFRDRVQRDSECYRTSAVGLDDGIIDPRDTRDVLGMCLDVVTKTGVSGAEAHRVLAPPTAEVVRLLNFSTPHPHLHHPTWSNESPSERGRPAATAGTFFRSAAGAHAHRVLRRKKTRCSGEKPICAFCARLGHECRYDDGPLAPPRPAPDVASSDSANLAARVALLESRLSLMDPNSLETLSGPHEDPPPAGGANKFSCLPSVEVLQDAADVYFRHCQNQPYCYFLESTFRQRLDEGSLPSYLLYSFMAVATRFSTHPFFEDHHAEAIESYARLAWSEILEKSFSDDHDVDVSTVQAANMLAVIDFEGVTDWLGRK
ncbi:carboxyl transferase domain-containing protein [Macrophomina phaseolina]|uniref:methylcrotonoyl-CoA carboxylase n=1 Tax=Macrophomina phaseolina TaxID=35725 RepID=A0ABQ8GSL8_9PEZI|nr:carboxyl transferase domain-containing protein [Macrophomina phaseolina]